MVYVIIIIYYVRGKAHILFTIIHIAQHAEGLTQTIIYIDSICFIIAYIAVENKHIVNI
jgi:hypothetical protein